MSTAVDEVLTEIGADEVPRLLGSRQGRPASMSDARQELRNRHPNAVLVSALSGEGLGELVERIEDEFAKRLREVELLIPYEEGGRLAELHEIAGDLKREDTRRRRPRHRAAARPDRRAVRSVRAQRPAPG